MTVVNPKSISGINSITTGSGSDNLLTIHTSDASNTERFRIDSTGTTKIVTGIVTTLTATTGIVTTFEATTGDITTLRTPTGIATHFTADKISLPDSGDGSLCIGIGSDLKLNHNGTDSFITEVGDGDLYIQGNDIILRDAGTLEKHIEMTQNGAVDLYHNGTKKLETSSTGATLSGNLSIDANIIHNGDTDTMLSFSAANQADIACGGTIIGRFTTDGLALGDNKRLDILDASGHRSGVINNADSGANALRISADPDNSASGSHIGFHVDGSEQARIGNGISFNGDTATANFLNDYEEGSWTPTITGGAITASGAYYTKIGRVVHWYLYATITNTANDSAEFRIYGLPYTVGDNSTSLNNYYGGAASFNYTQSANNAGLTSMGVLTRTGNTYVYFHFVGTGDSNAPVNSYIHSHLLNQGFIIAGAYFV